MIVKISHTKGYLRFILWIIGINFLKNNQLTFLTFVRHFQVFYGAPTRITEHTIAGLYDTILFAIASVIYHSLQDIIQKKIPTIFMIADLKNLSQKSYRFERLVFLNNTDCFWECEPLYSFLFLFILLLSFFFFFL